MEYKAIIEGKEYPLPKVVHMFNQDILNKYLFEDENEKYIDMDIFKEECSYDELSLISFQITNTIGEMMLEDEKKLSKFNEIAPDIRTLDNMAKMYYKSDNEEQAKDKLFDGIELVLDYYKKELEQELKQNKGSR